MRRRKTIILIAVIVMLLVMIFLGVSLYNYYRIKNAKIEVKLVDDLDVDVYSSVKISKFIKSINGKIINNKTIDTSEIGKKNIKFKFINDDNIKVSYSFDINIVDRVSPIVSKITRKTVKVGYTGDIAKELFCGDNYDDNPKCEIVGDYDLNNVGSYDVIFRGTDSSNNVSENNLTINVIANFGNSNTSSSEEEEDTGISFSEIVDKYKTSDNQIGIDVSKWQGDIDYKRVKDAGVSFVFIKVGAQKGIGGEYILDSKFKDNIEGFNKVGIPVGIYFFSYADSSSEAIKQAKWIKKQIKKYDVSLPIVFDWENWAFYQEFNLSFGHLSEMADDFMKEIKKSGYTPMLYSSKNYLETVWLEISYPVWLAHYTEQTDYEGDYLIWQVMEDGVVDGIDDNLVDIDIMYKNKNK